MCLLSTQAAQTIPALSFWVSLQYRPGYSSAEQIQCSNLFVTNFGMVCKSLFLGVLAWTCQVHPPDQGLDQAEANPCEEGAVLRMRCAV